MVKNRFTYMPLVLLLFLGFMGMAQKHLITDVRVNKSTVYVGEPVEVSVSVYSSTWFTKGVNPGNIKVNDAFTVYFRSLSNSKQINGQTYSGVTMTYNVFPYDDKDIVFPAMEFTVETPDKGGYQGVKRKVKTPSRKIKVKAVPPSFDRNEWLVTSNMTVNDSWSGNRNEVKVGDVLERRISRNVAGTVSELIPPIIWDSIAHVSLYPTRSEVNSNKTKTSINATRVDGVRYLFEKEGDVVIPEKELTWWNPRAQKVYKRTLPEVRIRVLPNPDLGMLETMRDSLNVTMPVEEDGASEEDQAFSFMGLSLKEFIVLLVGVIILLYFGVKLGKQFWNDQQQKKEIYRSSEAYYFKRFLASAGKNDPKAMVNDLYHWIDKLELQPPTIDGFVATFGDASLHEDLLKIQNFVKNPEDSALKLRKKEWIKARSNYLNSLDVQESTPSADWVNP